MGERRPECFALGLITYSVSLVALLMYMSAFYNSRLHTLPFEVKWIVLVAVPAIPAGILWLSLWLGKNRN